MATYIKLDGEWTETQRPYLKRNGVWTPIREIDVKDSGVWQDSYKYDAIPPSPPEITLQLVPTSGPRYIRVGARTPGTAHDPDLKRIRILVSRVEMPKSPFGTGFVKTAANNYPAEPWSDWNYNQPSANNALGDHGVSDEYDYKNWPPNPTDSTNISGGQYYYFAGWSEDFEGNWSTGTFTRIWMPKDGIRVDKLILKEAQIQANDAGSADAAGTFTEGVLVARDNPRSNGLWFYGNQFTNSVGYHGTPTIRSARILVSRRNDAGLGTANVRLGWINKNVGDGPFVNADFQDVTVLGTINKGEKKWFDIPSSYFSKFNTQIRALVLRYGTNSSDFLELDAQSDYLRCGEVRLVWEEAL